MAAVRLAVQAARRQSGIEVLIAVGHGLQQLQHVQPGDSQRVRAAVEGDVEPLPQVRPLADVSVAQVAIAADGRQ